MNIRTGIDLGGTKIEIIALNERDEVIHQKRIETPKGDYRGTINSIHTLVNELETRINAKTSIGIGTPGAISTNSGCVKNANSVCLNNTPLQEDLEARLGRKIKLSNDANCFALSESYDGAAKNAKSVFGVIIGTGTGAGLVINKQIIEGANRIAGEWGHNPLPWRSQQDDPVQPCYCGKSGCIETYLSGPGFENHFKSTFGYSLSTYEIVEQSQTSSDCESALKTYEHRLARALAHVINIFDPYTIVLGGGLSNIERLYQNVPKIWKNYVFSDVVITKLVPPKFGDASGVRGAARLWSKNEI